MTEAVSATIDDMQRDSLDRIRMHPFIASAHAGRLSRQQGQRWIKCAGRESRSFPTILQNMLATVGNPVVRDVLNENLQDEFGHGNPEHAHFKHYLHLLDHLNISRDEFYSYEEGPGISFALSVAYNVSKSEDLGLALGYMLVNEGMTPITYEAARVALAPYYPEMTTKFFQMHIDVDAHHVVELNRAVAQLHETQHKAVKFGILLGERGMAALLDEAYGIFDRVTELPVYEAA